MSCEYFGYDGYPGFGTLKACRTCDIKKDCHKAINDKKPYYQRLVTFQFICEKEFEENVDSLVNDIEKYIKRKIKKIPTCYVSDTGLDESGYCDGV